MVGALLLSLLGQASGLAGPLVVRDLVDGIGSDADLVRPLALLGTLVLFSVCIGALSLYLVGRTAESMVLRIRLRLLAGLLRLRIPALDRSEPGDLLSQVSADATQLRDIGTRLVWTITGCLSLGVSG